MHDAGKYLARYALPDAVRDAATRIRGQVSWAGSPQDFDYPTLNGKLRLETGRGQFTKLDPGLGKLLGVLSLQSLQAAARPSISRICSARASPSTKSPATCASRTA